MADFREVLQKTINAFVENNTLGVKNKDVTLFSAILTDDCIRMYRPLSFIQRYPQFFKTQITNADFEAQMRVELQTMKDVSQKISRTVIDTVERRATLWGELTVTTADGSVSKVEVIWDLNFSEDGTRVSQVMQFVDTYESTKVLEQILAKAGAH